MILWLLWMYGETARPRSQRRLSGSCQQEGISVSGRVADAGFDQRERQLIVLRISEAAVPDRLTLLSFVAHPVDTLQDSGDRQLDCSQGLQGQRRLPIQAEPHEPMPGSLSLQSHWSADLKGADLRRFQNLCCRNPEPRMLTQD